MIIATTFTLVSEACRHWCLIPLTLCGALAGSDFVAWLRKEVDSVDPKVFVAVHLYLSCFIAPQLHLAYNSYSGDYFHTGDWPKYFGYMAWLNLAGIILYKLGHKLLFSRIRPARTVWQIQPGRFMGIFGLLLTISLGAAITIKLVFGGLVVGGGGEFVPAAAHLSWVLMLGDPAPILLMMFLIYWLSRNRLGKNTSLAAVICLMILAMVLQFFFVGLRGSRSVIVLGVAVVAAMVHYRLRPFSMKLILVGGYLTIMFVYLYGFYKWLGPRGLQAFYSKEARESMRYELGGGGPLATFIGRGKSDIQAFILYNLMENEATRRYAWGKTYGWAVLYFVPRAVWKTKPFYTPKMVTGTIMQGQPPSMISSKVYGLGGEAMLNFGYWGIPPAFFIFGCLLGWFRKKLTTMEPTDSRFFVIPFLILTFALAVGSDVDNLAFGLLKMGSLPFLLIFLASSRSKLAALSEDYQFGSQNT